MRLLLIKLFFNLILIPFMFASCNYAYSPFQADTDGLPNYNHADNVAQLQKQSSFLPTNFTFAVISDTHLKHKDLQSSLKIISSLKSVKFVICTGDITDLGLKDEYRMFLHSLKSLSTKPFFTTVGNHDYLSNGKQLFLKIFGEANFYFIFQGYKFIFWDSITYEHAGQIPNKDWLINVLEDHYPKIIITHFSPQNLKVFSSLQSNYLLNLIKNNNTKIVLNGHKHGMNWNLSSNIIFFQPGSIQYKNFGLVEIQQSGQINLTSCRSGECKKLN